MKPIRTSPGFSENLFNHFSLLSGLIILHDSAKIKTFTELTLHMWLFYLENDFSGGIFVTQYKSSFSGEIRIQLDPLLFFIRKVLEQIAGCAIQYPAQAIKVEKRMARALLVLRIERLLAAKFVAFAKSFSFIRRSKSM